MNKTTRFKVWAPEDHPDVIRDQAGNTFIVFDLPPYQTDVAEVAREVGKVIFGDDYSADFRYELDVVSECGKYFLSITDTEQLNATTVFTVTRFDPNAVPIIIKIPDYPVIAIREAKV